MSRTMIHCESNCLPIQPKFVECDSCPGVTKSYVASVATQDLDFSAISPALLVPWTCLSYDRRTRCGKTVRQ